MKHFMAFVFVSLVSGCAGGMSPYQYQSLQSLMHSQDASACGYNPNCYQVYYR